MLKVNQQKMSLGTLKFGQPHSFTYTLTNTSSGTITVENIALGCNSCTKASVSKKNISPNENVTLNVIFTPGSTGAQKKSIDVQYKLENGRQYHEHIEFTAQVNGKS